MLDARRCRASTGRAPGRDQDLVGGDFLAARQPDRVGTGQRRALVEDRHVVVGERVGVGALEPADLGQHIVAQHRPVEALGRHVPAEHRGIVEVLGEMRAVDEQLLGHAAADDAGAADLIFLGDRRPARHRPRPRATARTPPDPAPITNRSKSAIRRPPFPSARASRHRGCPRRVPSASCRAISLPSSTPNWSNGLMPEQHRVGEGAVLVKGDQRAQRPRRRAGRAGSSRSAGCRDSCAADRRSARPCISAAPCAKALSSSRR